MRIIASLIRCFIKLFSSKNRKNNKELEFVAQVAFVTKETRVKSTVIICSILSGSINQGDIVLLLDKNKKVITEGKISVINYKTKSVKSVTKSDTDSNDIGLEFYNISDKNVENAIFVLK